MVQTLSDGLTPTSFQPTTTAPTINFEHEPNLSHDLSHSSRQKGQEGKNENYSERNESSQQKLVEPTARSQGWRKILAKATPSTIMIQLLVPKPLHGNNGRGTEGHGINSYSL